MVSIQEWEKIVNLISRLHQLKDNTRELRDYVLFHFPQFQNKSKFKKFPENNTIGTNRTI